MTDLIYWMEGAPLDSLHPQLAIRDLGISYVQAVPQSIASQWWFFGCKNIPNDLPEWISRKDFGDANQYIGWGLNQTMADKINTARHGG